MFDIQINKKYYFKIFIFNLIKYYKINIIKESSFVSGGVVKIWGQRTN